MCLPMMDRVVRPVEGTGFRIEGDPESLVMKVVWRDAAGNDHRICSLTTAVRFVASKLPPPVEGLRIQSPEIFDAAADAVACLLGKQHPEWDTELAGGLAPDELGDLVHAYAKPPIHSAIHALLDDYPGRGDAALLLLPVLEALDKERSNASGTSLVYDVPLSLLVLALTQVGWSAVFKGLTRNLAPEDKRAWVRNERYDQVLLKYLRHALGDDEVQERLETLGRVLKTLASHVGISPHLMVTWLSRLALIEAGSTDWLSLLPLGNPLEPLLRNFSAKTEANHASVSPGLVCHLRVESEMMVPEDLFVSLETIGELEPQLMIDFEGFEESARTIIRSRYFYAMDSNASHCYHLSETLSNYEQVDRFLLARINLRRAEKRIPGFQSLEKALGHTGKGVRTDHLKRLAKHRRHFMDLHERNGEVPSHLQVLVQAAEEGAVYVLLDRSARIRLAELAGMPNKKVPE